MGGRLVILDRDGVINVDCPQSIHKPEDLILLPDVGKAIALLNAADVRVVIATNQAVVGRGEITENDLAAIHEHMEALLAQGGAHIDKIYSCTDAMSGPRRKPSPGMLFEALEEFGADAAETPFVGDAYRDLEAAFHAGCKRVLVLTGKGKKTLESNLDAVAPVHLYKNLLQWTRDYLNLLHNDVA